MTLSNEKIAIIAAVIAISALSLYIAILRGQVRDTGERAEENLRRAEACEDALAIARRSHTAAIEAQGYADARRNDIEATRANLVRDVGAIVDSGVLDKRVCELARAAYHSALCAATDGRTMPAAEGAGAP